MIRIAISIALMAAAPATAQTLTCATSFQGYRVRQGPDGYRSTEWGRDGMRFGRSDRLELRRPVMARWANYVCGADDSNVIPLRAHERA